MIEKKLAPFVVIGVPTYSEKFNGYQKTGGGVSIEWAGSFYGIQTPLGSTCARKIVYDKIIDVARNDIVEYAKEVNAEWLFMVSDDVFVPPDAIMKMIAHGKEICTGIYFTKEYPPYPYIWRGLDGPYMDWKAGELFEIDFAGCDCLLIHRSVFEKLEYPYFSRDWSWYRDKNGKVLSPGSLSTEDFYFFAKAKEAGFKVWCDSSVLCVHQDRHTGKKFGLLPGMPQFTNKQELDVSKNSLIAVIGAGLNDYEYIEGKHVRIDNDEKCRPDLRSDLKYIAVNDETYDVVFAPNILQKFRRDEVTDCLNEWIRLLKIGGTFILTVPNAEVAFNRIVQGGLDGLDRIYGQNDDYRNIFTKSILESMFSTSTLLKDVKVEHIDDKIKVIAIKTKHHEPTVLHEKFQGKYVEQTITKDATKQTKNS